MNGLLKELHLERLGRRALERLPVKTVLVKGCEVSVVEQPGKAIGSVRWKGCEALSSWLLEELGKQQQGDGLRILELGSGVGVCSLLLGATGHEVIASDCEPMMGLLEYNVGLNRNTNTRALELDWECYEGGVKDLDLIIGADIVYNHTMGPLHRTLALLLKENPRAHAILAYKMRDAEPESMFFQQFRCEKLARTEDHDIIKLTCT